MAGASAAMAAFASFADWKRQHRKDIDRVGFMPWTLVTVMGVVARADVHRAGIEDPRIGSPLRRTRNRRAGRDTHGRRAAQR
jgi:hypothetical protein